MASKGNTNPFITNSKSLFPINSGHITANLDRNEFRFFVCGSRMPRKRPIKNIQIQFHNEFQASVKYFHLKVGPKIENNLLGASAFRKDPAWGEPLVPLV